MSWSDYVNDTSTMFLMSTPVIRGLSTYTVIVDFILLRVRLKTHGSIRFLLHTACS